MQDAKNVQYKRPVDISSHRIQNEPKTYKHYILTYQALEISQ